MQCRKEASRGRSWREGRVLLVLVVAVLILASCGSSSDSSTPEGNASAPENAEVDNAGVEEADETPPPEADESESVESTDSEAESVEPTLAPATTTTESIESTGNAELDLLVDELSAYVEEERGLTFTSRPQISLLDDDAFGQAWVELVANDASENATSYQDFTDIYQAMGIISVDATLEEIWIRFGEAGVIGYYETESEEIVLRNGEINALARTTLVHELVHALEDQNFDLDRESYEDREDEINWAFSALAEGSARVIENRYRASLSNDERAEEQSAIAELPRSVSFSEFNQSFLELQFGLSLIHI